MSWLDKDDLVFYKDANTGQLMSAGYKINGIFAELGIPPIQTSQSILQSGGVRESGCDSTSSPIYAIPTALILLQQGIQPDKFMEVSSSDKVVGEDLYSKLLKLAGRKSRQSLKRTMRKRQRSTHVTRKRSRS